MMVFNEDFVKNNNNDDYNNDNDDGHIYLSVVGIRDTS